MEVVVVFGDTIVDTVVVVVDVVDCDTTCYIGGCYCTQSKCIGMWWWCATCWFMPLAEKLKNMTCLYHLSIYYILSCLRAYLKCGTVSYSYAIVPAGVIQ